MIDKVQAMLDFLGWGKPHLLAILYSAGLSTGAAWLVKIPLRYAFDHVRAPLDLYRWALRSLVFAAAVIGAGMSWPDSGRYAFLGGTCAAVLVLTLYSITGPLVARFWPWISSDYHSRLNPLEDE